MGSNTDRFFHYTSKQIQHVSQFPSTNQMSGFPGWHLFFCYGYKLLVNFTRLESDCRVLTKIPLARFNMWDWNTWNCFTCEHVLNQVWITCYYMCNYKTYKMKSYVRFERVKNLNMCEKTLEKNFKMWIETLIFSRVKWCAIFVRAYPHNWKYSVPSKFKA